MGGAGGEEEPGGRTAEVEVEVAVVEKVDFVLVVDDEGVIHISRRGDYKVKGS